jgi:hypothetical protein
MSGYPKDTNSTYYSNINNNNNINLKRPIVSIIIDNGDYDIKNQCEFKSPKRKIFKIQKIKKIDKECLTNNKIEYSTDKLLLDKLFSIKNTVSVKKKTII